MFRAGLTGAVCSAPQVRKNHRETPRALKGGATLFTQEVRHLARYSAKLEAYWL